MSYEGYEEFICDKGHYWTCDALEYTHCSEEEKGELLTCPHCNNNAKWNCSVNETNGYNHRNPRTYDGPKKELDFDEFPSEDDPHGEATEKVYKYQPLHDTNRWKLMRY